MNNEPVAWIKKKEIGYMEVTKRCGAKDYATNLGLVPEDDDIPLYTHPAKTLTDRITDLENVNAKQVDYIAEQKLAYEKLWKEHMELFWKHEQDKDLTNE